jgi:hypothetical protein
MPRPRSARACAPARPRPRRRGAGRARVQGWARARAAAGPGARARSARGAARRGAHFDVIGEVFLEDLERSLAAHLVSLRRARVVVVGFGGEAPPRALWWSCCD